MATREEIEKLANGIAREFHPERIVLFGSHARGTPSPDSDVDLLIVVNHSGKGWELASQIRMRFAPDFPVDFIVRTPEEYRSRLSLFDPFFREIATQGKPLYEA